MELLDEALMSARTPLRITALLKRALGFEKAAADSVATRVDLEPTRSVLHRSAANLALRVGDHATAVQYVDTGLQGHPPTEIKLELQSVREQALVLQALTTDYRRKAPAHKTRIEQILERYRATIPVDIAGMATALGISVTKGDLAQNRGEVLKDPLRGGSSGFRIRVNNSDPEEVQRFTIGHEISHILLHRNRISNRLLDDRMYRSDLGNSREEQADKLALDLLIPGNQLAAIRKEIGSDAVLLAARFNVPLEEMEIRLRIRKRRIRL
jgi:Zn-dependent peptidase ImmA (M78 family)